MQLIAGRRAVVLGDDLKLRVVLGDVDAADVGVQIVDGSEELLAVLLLVLAVLAAAGLVLLGLILIVNIFARAILARGSSIPRS